MSYIKTTWVNGGTPAINSTNLNKIEDGIESLDIQLSTADQTTLTQTASIYTTGTGKNSNDVDVDVSASIIKGQVSGVVVMGNTYTNLITNGDFGNGTTGWSTSTHNPTVIDGRLRVNGDGAGVSCQFNTTLPSLTQGNVYFIKFDLSPDVTANRDLRVFLTGETVVTKTTGLSGVQYFKYTKGAGASLALGVNYRNLSGAFPSAEYVRLDNVVVVDMTSLGLASLTADEINARFPHWFNGTKSTVSGQRVESVNADETETSTQYINTGGELRSLPNGVADEVEDGVETQRVSEAASISGTVYASIDTATYTNVSVVKTTAFALATAGTTGIDGKTRYYNSAGLELTEVTQANIDLTASIGKYYYHTDKTVWIIVGKATYADIAAARTDLGTTTLNYQLATPVISNADIDGQLVAYPNGTTYFTPYHKKSHIYSTGLTFDYALLSIDKVIDIDGDEVDFSTVTLVADGLTATISGASATDAYVVYGEIRSELSTIPTSTLTYSMNTKAVIEGVVGASQRNADDIADINDFRGMQAFKNEQLAAIAKFSTATGTATAIAVTAPQFSLADGATITFIASGTSAAAKTININGLGAKNAYRPNTTAAANHIEGKAYTYWYNLAGDSFFIKASAEGDAIAANVLASKTFSNDDDTGITGTLVLTPIAALRLSKVAESLSYGGTMLALAYDGTYIYGAGSTTQKVYQYDPSDMSKVAESGDYGGAIYALAYDGTYIYGAGTATQKVYQYYTTLYTKTYT